MSMIASIYGQNRRTPEEVRRDGWQELGILAVPMEDSRLSWTERELIQQLGNRLYGKRRPAREVNHG